MNNVQRSNLCNIVNSSSTLRELGADSAVVEPNGKKLASDITIEIERIKPKSEYKDDDTIFYMYTEYDLKFAGDMANNRRSNLILSDKAIHFLRKVNPDIFANLNDPNDLFKNNEVFRKDPIRFQPVAKLVYTIIHTEKDSDNDFIRSYLLTESPGPHSLMWDVKRVSYGALTGGYVTIATFSNVAYRRFFTQTQSYLNNNVEAYNHSLAVKNELNLISGTNKSLISMLQDLLFHSGRDSENVVDTLKSTFYPEKGLTMLQVHERASFLFGEDFKAAKKSFEAANERMQANNEHCNVDIRKLT